jgi:DNA-binding CsgD family transcriptional regulator
VPLVEGSRVTGQSTQVIAWQHVVVDLSTLTKAEREAFDLLVEGLHDQQIADRLHKPLGTIKKRLSRIYEKLGGIERGEAIARYARERPDTAARSAEEVAASQSRFLQQYKRLKDHRQDLEVVALRLHAEAQSRRQVRFGTDTLRLPVLAKAGWISTSPVRWSFENERSPLHWIDSQRGEDATDVDLKRLAQELLPFDELGQRYESFSDAVGGLVRPQAFWNGRCYRVRSVGGGPLGPSFTFGPGRYFEFLNSCEILGFELAGAVGTMPATPLRSRIRDLFDLSRRHVVPGVDALTLIRRADGLKFIMHNRSSHGGVAHAMGSYHVTPAGVFEQLTSEPRPADTDADFSFWHNLVREYAEEFLGVLDREKFGLEVDYATDKDYRAIEAAFRDGGVKLWFFGTVMDPLSLQVEVLFTCVWDEAVFDAIFGPRFADDTMTLENPEGQLIVGNRLRPGLDFTSSGHIREYLRDRTLPSGKTLLLLAWEAREQLAMSR